MLKSYFGSSNLVVGVQRIPYVFYDGVVECPCIYSTFFPAELPPVVPLDQLSAISSDFDNVKIVYALILTGRGWRHVQRMFRLLYHTSNYFYIHVDSVGVNFLFYRTEKRSLLQYIFSVRF